MSTYQYATAVSDRLNVRRFVLGMRLNGHEFLVQVGHWKMPMACSGWLRRWIYFGARGAAWLLTYGQETEMPFIRKEEIANYEFRLTCMLLRVQCSILNGDSTQDLILLSVELCCFDHLFPSAWFSTQCDHFLESLDFKHRFRERRSSLPIFVPGHCVETYLIPSKIRGRFNVSVDYLEWRGLETHRALLVPTPAVFANYSNGCLKVAPVLWSSHSLASDLLSVRHSVFAGCYRWLVRFLLP